jgi:hypothetical protein
MKIEINLRVKQGISKDMFCAAKNKIVRENEIILEIFIQGIFLIDWVSKEFLYELCFQMTKLMVFEIAFK